MMITTTANEDERILEEKVNGAEFFFAVADANDVPMEDDSVDISLSVFAPRNGKEIERTMKEKGTFLVVSPSPLHLQELRSNEAKERGVICLNIEDNKSERVEKQLKELTSLSPIESSSRSDSNSSSEIIERRPFDVFARRSTPPKNGRVRVPPNRCVLKCRAQLLELEQHLQKQALQRAQKEEEEKE